MNNKLTPFKMCVLDNFPFIEADFDALTNYELLSKIVEYLNKLNNSQNELSENFNKLYDEFVNLKNYIDDYFENLDVQEEINNKLDQMVEDGTFTELVSSYVDPIYQAYESEINGIVDNQNIRITNVEEELESVANGSPAGVYDTLSDLTSADPDHDRIYVVSADGKWYYYSESGSTWVAGGQYQTSESGDDVLKIKNIMDYSNLNLYDESENISGYISSSGITSHATYTYAKIPVVAGTTYYVYRESQSYADTEYFAFLDDNNTVTGITAILGHLIYNDNKLFIKIVAPDDAEYLLLNTRLYAFNDKTSTIVYIKPAISELYGYDINLRNRIDKYNSYFSLNKINKEYIKGSFVRVNNDSSVSKVTSTNTACCKCSVTAGTTYYLYRESQDYSGGKDAVVFGNSENDLVSGILLTELTKVTLLNNEKVCEFTVPEGMTHVYFNIKLTTYDDIDNLVMLTEVPTEYVNTANDYYFREYVKNTLVQNIQPSLLNRLRTKSWCCLGDSITALTYRSTKNYHDYIAERCGCTVDNLGISSIGYVKKVTIDEQQKNICDLIDELTGSEDYDYITIFAGTNDKNETLGTISSTDKTTVYGAIKYCVTELIRKFPTKKIGLLTPLPRDIFYGTSDNNALYLISKAIKEVGAYYSIPVLDQYTSCGLRPWNATNNATFFSCEQAPTGDGTHPNALGHEWISYDIQDFMQLL